MKANIKTWRFRINKKYMINEVILSQSAFLRMNAKTVKLLFIHAITSHICNYTKVHDKKWNENDITKILPLNDFTRSLKKIKY